MQRNLGEYYSYSEIADVLGVVPETVRKIERKALLKLRKTLMRRGLGVEQFFDDARRRSGKP